MSNSFATPWTVACQAHLSMEFPRRKYWSGLPLPSPGDLPDPEIESESFCITGRFFTTDPPGLIYMASVFNSKYPQDYIYFPA